MLKIMVLGTEMFDSDTGLFFTEGDVELRLEHSLVSLSKWESSVGKPLLSDEEMSGEEWLEYIKAMCLDEVPEEVLMRLSVENIKEVNAYINKPMTATWFSDEPERPRGGETFTAELIYYWMTVYNIPLTCENWHLNRLFTLIRVTNIKNSKPKKMSRSELMAKRRALNEKRRAQYSTTG